ncbi:MAG: hypothetical protein FJ352_03095, partial [Firmicutes bacterium]|nr:hypothetical protein [Bacillota bacterium]
MIFNQARLLNEFDVLLVTNQSLTTGQIQSIKLNTNHLELSSLSLLKEDKTTGLFNYVFRTKDAFTLGQSYALVIEQIGSI